MGDSGQFGPAMKNVPNSNFKPFKKMKPKGMPAVKPPQATRLQGGNVADAFTINQGRPKRLTVKQARKMPLHRLEKRLK
jgi:hypothetical protein